MNENTQKTVKLLKEYLDSDRFPLQSRLPPERALAGEFGVSRATLRKALGTLEKEGRIWRHVGRGTFIGPRPEPDQEEFSTVTSVTNPTEIMEARLVLEPKLAAIAALRVTMSELNQMEVFLERSIGAIETAEFEYWDGLIHQAIAKATDNSLLISIFSLIHNVRHSEVWGRLKEASLTTDRRKIYSSQHSEIVKALKDRDAIKAENLMKEHLEIIKDHLLKISPIT